MCRMVGWVARTPVTLRELLGEQGVAQLLALATIHCHGWGVAYYDGPELVVERSPLAACDDPAFLDVIDSVQARAAVVHLRMGTPGYGRTTIDNHPFTDGAWALIHNGAVAPVSGVDKLLAPGSARRPDGSTDSERWFLALRDELDRGRSVAAAVRAVIERATSVGLHASSWNSMLLGPDALHVIVHHDPALLPMDVKLWPDAYPANIVCWPPYFDLRVRRRADSVLVASSGIVDDITDWELLPNMSVLDVPLDDGSAAEVVELARIQFPA
jgi:predicted glutamine amidotransferase